MSCQIPRPREFMAEGGLILEMETRQGRMGGTPYPPKSPVFDQNHAFAGVLGGFSMVMRTGSAFMPSFFPFMPSYFAFMRACFPLVRAFLAFMGAGAACI